MTFADRLSGSIDRNSSVLCAGFDPQPEIFPAFIIDEATQNSTNDTELVRRILTQFYGLALEALQGKVACIKPNLAFFEQFGIGGLAALREIIDLASRAELPVIADAKRGDIGSTAEAYAKAFLGSISFDGRKIEAFGVDALTVNPFLGFDTLEPFLKECENSARGIFVLVKTSNPGSKDLQDLAPSEKTISVRLAEHLAKHSHRLAGSCGLSGVGAVVGATHPSEAKALRDLMPSNYFLIPGYGAQGGSAQDAVAGFSKDKNGGIVNVSRALFAADLKNAQDREAFILAIQNKAAALNAPLQQALTSN